MVINSKEFYMDLDLDKDGEEEVIKFISELAVKCNAIVRSVRYKDVSFQGDIANNIAFKKRG